MVGVLVQPESGMTVGLVSCFEDVRLGKDGG